MSLNTRNAAPLLKGRSRFAEQQEAEFAWWRNYLRHPTAKQRMLALYGARYYGLFFAEMMDAGRTVEIGSGPLPVMETMLYDRGVAIDTLGPRYKVAGLTSWEILPSAEGIETGWADTVLLLNVLDHTDDPAPLVAQAHRILRDGGKALVFVHLGPGDDKHIPIQPGDCGRWLGVFGDVVSHIADATVYDPPAYVAVAVKHG